MRGEVKMVGLFLVTLMIFLFEVIPHNHVNLLAGYVLNIFRVTGLIDPTVIEHEKPSRALN